MMTLDALHDQRFDLEVGIMILTTGKARMRKWTMM